MRTIDDELKKLETTKVKIKAALIAKGIPSNEIGDIFEYYADWIERLIVTGVEPLTIVTDIVNNDMEISNEIWFKNS